MLRVSYCLHHLFTPSHLTVCKVFCPSLYGTCISCVQRFFFFFVYFVVLFVFVFVLFLHSLSFFLFPFSLSILFIFICRKWSFELVNGVFFPILDIGIIFRPWANKCPFLFIFCLFYSMFREKVVSFSKELRFIKKSFTFTQFDRECSRRSPTASDRATEGRLMHLCSLPFIMALP